MTLLILHSNIFAQQCKADFSFTLEEDCGQNVGFFADSTAFSNYAVYTWDFNDKTKRKIGSQVTHNFKAITGRGSTNYNVTLYVEDSSNGCNDTTVQVISVAQKPDVYIEDIGDDPASSFASCDGAPGILAVEISSRTMSSISKCEIDWGDGSPVTKLNGSKLPSQLEHTYHKVGTSLIMIQAVGVNGCVQIKKQEYYVGTLPDIGISVIGPPNQHCGPYPVQVTIEKISGNSEGTKYIFSEYEGGPTKEYTHPLRDTVFKYILRDTSCGSGNKGKFEAIMKAVNGCGDQTARASLMAINYPPEAKIEVKIPENLCPGEHFVFCDDNKYGFYKKGKCVNNDIQ